MTKQLFLNELAAALHSLPREERYRTLGYYDELIDDRMEAVSYTHLTLPTNREV